MRDKRPATSRTLGNETVKATAGWPGGSGEEEGADGGGGGGGAGCLFVCPLAQRLGVCQRLHHFTPALPVCTELLGKEKSLVPVQGVSEVGCDSPSEGGGAVQGPTPRGSTRGRYNRRWKTSDSNALIYAFNQTRPTCAEKEITDRCYIKLNDMTAPRKCLDRPLVASCMFHPCYWTRRWFWFGLMIQESHDWLNMCITTSLYVSVRILSSYTKA